MGVILATSRSFSSGSIDLVGRLAAAGHTVVRGPSGHDLDGMRPGLRAAVGWIAGTGVITAAHLDAAPKLRVIARYGVGVEAVDLLAAVGRGIVVTNTPGANSGAVADHTIGLMLAVLRGITDGDRRVRSGDWSARRGRELGSLTVGIIGFGRIGRGVATRLSGFGSRVVAYDPWMTADQLRDGGATAIDPTRIAAECDVVSLHAPGGAVIVDPAWLETASRGIILVNTARPELVDEAALADAIRADAVAGYGADTLAGDTRGDSSPLLSPDIADRVTVTPHLGAQTVEAIDGMGSMAVANLLAVLAGETPPNRVLE